MYSKEQTANQNRYKLYTQPLIQLNVLLRCCFKDWSSCGFPVGDTEIHTEIRKVGVLCGYIMGDLRIFDLAILTEKAQETFLSQRQNGDKSGLFEKLSIAVLGDPQMEACNDVLTGIYIKYSETHTQLIWLLIDPSITESSALDGQSG